MAAYRRVDDLSYLRVTACTLPGSALRSTLSNELWEAFTFTFYFHDYYSSKWIAVYVLQSGYIKNGRHRM